MQKCCNSNYKLKFNNDIINRLRESRELDIFLIEAQATKFKEHHHTFICGNIYIRTDTNDLYRIEGVVENFGVERDEVFTITIKEGWLDFQIQFDGNNRKIVFGQLLSDIVNANNLNLLHYDSFSSTDNFSIEVKSTFEELHDISSNITQNVEIDEALIIKDSSKSIYIGQHVFPYSIIITKDDMMIKELTK